MINCYCYIARFETYLNVGKKSTVSFTMFSRKCVYKSYLFYIYVKAGFALNNLQWLICHKTQPNQIINV